MAEARHPYPMVHHLEDTRLLIRIMEEGANVEAERWIREDRNPDWTRHVLATFLRPEDRFDWANVIGEFLMVKDYIMTRYGFN